MGKKKIVITGLPGSGKTSFATKLSKSLNIPLYHLDKIVFLPGGAKRDKNEFIQLQNEIIKKKEWIIEGCGLSTLEMRYSQAAIVIYFEVSRWLCLWRSLKRFLLERNLHPDTPEGCSKVFNFTLIKYIWGFKKNHKLKIKQLQRSYPKVKFYLVTNSSEAADLQAEILEKVIL